MATYLHTLEDSQHIRKWVYERRREAEKCRPTEYAAAVKIQSWFRGTQTRCYLKILNKQAIQFQRHWRGILGRRAYQRRLKEAALTKQLAYYNQKATRIQKIWRGWYVRRHVFDFSVWKAYFAYIEEVTNIVRQKVDEYWKSDSNPRIVENQCLLKIMKYSNRKKHHLLGTEVQVGMYCQKNHPELLQVEKWIRRMKPILAENRAEKAKPPYMLPPMRSRKPNPQGPFRDPLLTHKLKHQPSKSKLLPMEPDSIKLDAENTEKQRRSKWIHDFPFYVIGPEVCEKEEQTEFPYLSRTSPYGKPLKYGNVYFREPQPEKNLHEHELKTRPLVPLEKVYEQKYEFPGC